ncbi:MAG: two-component system response regulator [Magnetococcales bacterium]|nr:two-component system response regulator [Magnetococcales bacterium]HIJ83217.1 response regulator [Magnetococcales bacterium]
MNHILLVDDDNDNLMLLQDILEDTEFTMDLAHDGDEALAKLMAAPENFDAVLLDRRMPKVNGMEVLSAMKKHPVLKNVPVIFQTSMAHSSEIVEGLQAGAFYYLTKPYPEDDILVAMVRAAVNDFQSFCEIRRDSHRTEQALALTEVWELQFQNMDEARAVAFLLGRACFDPARVTTALLELLFNAVEHGNLGITYAEKTALNNEGTFLEEVQRRLHMEAHAHKRVRVAYKKMPEFTMISVQDEGEGFDWNPYLVLSPERVFDNHGRGIALSVMMDGVEVAYQGCGNRVHLTFSTNGHTK